MVLKISVIDSLRKLKVGEFIYFQKKDVKENTVRVTAVKLGKSGYYYSVCSRKLSNIIKVERLA